MYQYCRPTVRLGWVGGGVTDEKRGVQEMGGGSGPPDPPLDTPMNVI